MMQRYRSGIGEEQVTIFVKWEGWFGCLLSLGRPKNTVFHTMCLSTQQNPDHLYICRYPYIYVTKGPVLRPLFPFTPSPSCWPRSMPFSPLLYFAFCAQSTPG
uniref:Uncharacterized protein n=1 Tax=Trypanosoma vivax (strain Y486) TaxID=1055687 RepID=G0TRD8_TRYVY|nr:hypothetical protein, unlikely [Trypanosoma vivax Y486]